MGGGGPEVHLSHLGWSKGRVRWGVVLEQGQKGWEPVERGDDIS